jgi:CheY-like chemotaxis protein
MATGVWSDVSDWDFATPILDERARRLEFACALLRAGGLAPDRARNIVTSELRGVVDDAEQDGDQALGAVATAVREMVLALGDGAPELPCSILMLDDNEVTRDLVVIALEAQGHEVRVAADLDGFEKQFKRRRPNVVVTEARIKSARLEDVANRMQALFAGGALPVVLFAQETGESLERLARRVRADRWITKDQGISSLISNIEQLLDELIW